MYAAAPFADPSAGPSLAGETRLLFLLTFAICVVVPHSAQALTAALLFLTAMASLFALRGGGKLSYIGLCYLLGAIVTCVYLAVGLARGAPAGAIAQTTAIYIISPLAWIVILRAALQLNSIERMTRLLIVLAWLACASVAIFFYLYLSFGRDAVGFLSESANLYVGEGYSGATMHVYASLIFLSAGFFAAPEVIKSKLNRGLLLAALGTAAVTSGRASLIFALPIGLIMGLVARQFAGRAGGGRGEATQKPTLFRYAASTLGIVAVLLVLDYFVADIDLSRILQQVWEKLTGGGGEARIDQTYALWQGVADSWGLGAGHGIGATIERNTDFAWRYENVPLATIYRVGVIGAAIYVLPFLIYLMRAGRRVVHGSLPSYDRFMLGGFAGMLLAAPTNPYLESFIFQWMFILPLVSLEMTTSGAHGHRPAEPRRRLWSGRQALPVR